MSLSPRSRHAHSYILVNGDLVQNEVRPHHSFFKQWEKLGKRWSVVTSVKRALIPPSLGCDRYLNCRQIFMIPPTSDPELNTGNIKIRSMITWRCVFVLCCVWSRCLKARMQQRLLALWPPVCRYITTEPRSWDDNPWTGQGRACMQVVLLDSRVQSRS